ncbi:hypothetical protein SAMN04489761_3459 [Tenacibaculum sp. MAR_2009_124]|uniref:hypothetical protein n=1 Tax=Tenacibaculum sp. MAR_2009_124 TaxID=1250059 RepID=UPI00089584DB|nr:hypothetical protein [Tenacibaculum sp. MAR_2009_124]SEC67091.1 hypothetical protein SAMN04489761_3459 [Tenacibaculum sp. MAR_2009_124]
MSKINIPENYPKGCSEGSIKKVVQECQNKISKINDYSNVVLGSTYYAQLAEQGNAELNRRLNEKLITNLEKSSKRQRELTWAIIIIGGANLVLVLLKLLNIINLK